MYRKSDNKMLTNASIVKCINFNKIFITFLIFFAICLLQINEQQTGMARLK